MIREHEKSGQWKFFLAKNITHRTLAPPLSKTCLRPCITLSNTFLPMQIFYNGKTIASQPRQFNSPSGFLFPQNPQHWSNEEVLKLIQKVINPYVVSTQLKLGLALDQKGLSMYFPQIHFQNAVLCSVVVWQELQKRHSLFNFHFFCKSKIDYCISIFRYF